MGIGAFVSSPGESFIAIQSGFAPSDIIVTGSNFTEKEFSFFLENNLIVNLDSLGQLDTYGRLSKGGKIGIRVNPDIKIIPEESTNNLGIRSRMGIWEKDLDEALDKARKWDLEVIGIQQYVGTNTLDSVFFVNATKHLINLAKSFGSLRYVDIGGGFGVDYTSAGKDFNWEFFGDAVSRELADLSKYFGYTVELKMEPGRTIMARSGILLAEVVDIKHNEKTVFVGTNASLSNFIRPYLYDAKHKVVSFASGKEVYETCNICGNSVASGDFLAKNVTIPRLKAGDIIGICDVGAYGYTMSSHFCGRVRPAEVLFDGKSMKLIRRREDFMSLIEGVLDE